MIRIENLRDELQRRRKEAGYTREDLAKKLNISRARVWRMETIFISIESASEYCEALGLELLFDIQKKQTDGRNRT